MPPSPQHHPLWGTKPARDENRYCVKLRRTHKIFSTPLNLLTIILESPDDIVVVIITLYLCFGPCTELHQNGYWKRCAAFYFYVLLTIQPLYFMRYAQFYALAIFFMYRLTPKGELLMERKTVHDFLFSYHLEMARQYESEKKQMPRSSEGGDNPHPYWPSAAITLIIH